MDPGVLTGLGGVTGRLVRCMVGSIFLEGILIFKNRSKNSSSQANNACLSSGERFIQSMCSGSPRVCVWPGALCTDSGGGEGVCKGVWSGRVSLLIGGGPGNVDAGPECSVRLGGGDMGLDVLELLLILL